MDIDVEALPNDTEKLKAVLVEVLGEHDRVLGEQRQAYVELQEKFETLRQMYFGKSSERLTEEDRRQIRLFNEAEELVGEKPETEEPESITVGEHRRKRSGRKAISKELPREEIIHDLSEEEKHCACCGELRPLLDDETSEEIEIVPASVKVLHHIRKVYGPCRCKDFEASEQQPIKRAVIPPRMIPGSIAAAGTLAYVVTAKFVDALPLYRQEKIFSRLGVEIHRSTLANWVTATAARCGPLIDLLWEHSKHAVLQQMDETTVQVLHEPNRPPTSKSYIWVNLAHVVVGEHKELKVIVLYHYHPSRSAKIVTSSLDRHYRGYLQTDGYEAYAKAIADREGIIHVGCLAHARRKFHEAAKLAKKPGSAQAALALIAKVYRIETECRKLLDEGKIDRGEFLKRRDEHARPILEKLMKWLDERVEQVPPTSKLGEAIGYARHQMPKIMHYLEQWFLTPDNNAVERAIRPFVIGRSNWLFCDTPRGAHASAALYSLVETAKANGLEPCHYFRFLFTHLPTAKDEEDFAKLLPMNLKPTDLLEA